MKNKKKLSLKKALVLPCIVVTSLPVTGEEIGPHFAFANYLGSGIYRTTGQNASLLNLPFSYDIAQTEKTTYNLRLPVSLGFFNFDFSDIPELGLPEQVGTATFTPGIEFIHQYSEQWVIESYFDLGYARNFSTKKGVAVHSAGVSGLYHFNVEDYDAIWANRLYYAYYDGNGWDAADSYAALQVGIDIGLPVRYQLMNNTFQPRFFVSTFWYFNQIEFNIPLNSEETSDIAVTNSVELGFTLKFEKKIGYSWAGINHIGFSYRYSDKLDVFRLLFSFPI